MYEEVCIWYKEKTAANSCITAKRIKVDQCSQRVIIALFPGTDHPVHQMSIGQ